MSKQSDGAEVISLNKGQFLFHAGEKGGDLYFIDAGRVDIVNDHEGQQVVLATMAEGELIGVMTCLTNEPRMASARAQTPVTLRRIPHANIKDQLSRMPKWMGIVIKEYGIRLTQMNDAFSDSTLAIKKLKKTQLSSVYTAFQMTSAIPTLAKYVERKVYDDTFIAMEDMFTILEMTLCQSKDELDKIFSAMLSSGLAKVEIHPESKNIILKKDYLKRITEMHGFLNDIRSGKFKRLNDLRLSNKDSRILMALCKLASSLYGNANENCELAFETAKDHFRNKAGLDLDMDTLRIANDAKLLTLKGGEDSGSIAFIPNKMEKLVRCLEAYRRIKLIDGPGANNSIAV